MDAKADTMGMNQRVAPFLDWLRAATVEPHQSIAALTSMDLADSTLAQRQGIRTSLPPPSAASKPSDPAAAALSSASLGPTVEIRSFRLNGDIISHYIVGQ